MVSQLQEFMGVEEKRGLLWSLMDPSGPSDQPPPFVTTKLRLWQQHWSKEISRLFNPYKYRILSSCTRSATPAFCSGKYHPRAPAGLARWAYLQGYQALCINQTINTYWYRLDSGPDESGRATKKSVWYTKTEMFVGPPPWRLP